MFRLVVEKMRSLKIPVIVVVEMKSLFAVWPAEEKGEDFASVVSSVS